MPAASQADVDRQAIRTEWEHWIDVCLKGDADGYIAFRRYAGIATFTPKAGGAPMHNDRKYIDILRRGADGRWRVVYHLFTPR